MRSPRSRPNDWASSRIDGRRHPPSRQELAPAMLKSFALSCVAALAFGYLLGSIPFGLILTRLAGTPDIRAIGSGNIGATNVLRTGNKTLAAATLIGDTLKGTAAVLAARYAFGPDAALAAAVGALRGHICPAWL